VSVRKVSKSFFAGVRCFLKEMTGTAPRARRFVTLAEVCIKKFLNPCNHWVEGKNAFVVGYPKVGNTWFQVMLRKALVSYYGLSDDWLSNILYPQTGAIEVLPKGIPHIEITHNLPGFPMGSFKQISIDNSQFLNKKVLLLIRDPRDALVSLYMQYVYREREQMFYGDVNDLVYDEEYGLDKYLKYYKAWYEDRLLPSDLLLVRYEDMQADTARLFKKAMQFLGMEGITDTLIDECVQYGSFQNMRKMEMNNTLGLPTLAPSPRNTENSFKVRSGKIGGYVEYLKPETIQYINRRISLELPRVYNYPRTTAFQ